jgi:hypothetical protein
MWRGYLDHILDVVDDQILVGVGRDFRKARTTSQLPCRARISDTAALAKRQKREESDDAKPDLPAARRHSSVLDVHHRLGGTPG